MILTCSQCATRYHADEAKFPPSGRTVRCSKCRHTWHQPGYAAATQPGQVLAPSIQSNIEIAHWPDPFAGNMTRPPAVITSAQPQFSAEVAGKPNSSRFTPFVAFAGWGALFATVLLIALSIIHYRADLATIRPRLGSSQFLASRKIEMQGVDLRDVGYWRETIDGQIMLVLTGTISNSADRALPVPKTILVTLSDENNHQLFHAIVPAKVATLGPGESVMFRARIHNLPSTNPRLHMGLQD